MSDVKITIVTATYNAAGTLAQAIESVVRQSYAGLEYVIVDGASTDGTVAIIERYAAQYPDIIRYVSEPDAGIYDAFNKGARLSTGDYVLYLGADDSLVACDIIESLAAELTPEVDVLSGTARAVSLDGSIEWTLTNDAARNRAQHIAERSFVGMIPHSGMLMRRELLLRYPFDTSFRIAADYDVFLHYYFDSTVSFRFVDMPVAFFALGGVSSSSSLTATLERENAAICARYGMEYPRMSFLRRIRQHVAELPFLQPLRMFYRHHLRGWQPHTCDNPLCRWCGRA